MLKLSGHVRNTISLLYMQKTGWNSDIWNFFSEKIDFLSILVYVHWKSGFWVRTCWKRHCDVIRWPIFMILVSMERGDPTLYYGTKQSYFGPVNFKFIRGGGNHPPLGKPCYKKRLGRTRVNVEVPLITVTVELPLIRVNVELPLITVTAELPLIRVNWTIPLPVLLNYLWSELMLNYRWSRSTVELPLITWLLNYLLKHGCWTTSDQS